MGLFDTTTAMFEEAATEHTAAAVEVRELAMRAFHIRGSLNDAQTGIQDRERRVARSPAVHAAMDDGQPPDAETITTRTVGILGNDAQYLEEIETVTRGRRDVAEIEADLERARDRRTLAERRLDLAVATAAPDPETKARKRRGS